VNAEADQLASQLCADPLFQAQVKEWGNTSLGLTINGQGVLIIFEISFDFPSNQTGVLQYWVGNTGTGTLTGPFVQWSLPVGSSTLVLC
jgi:hypothetical protein